MTAAHTFHHRILSAVTASERRDAEWQGSTCANTLRAVIELHAPDDREFNPTCRGCDKASAADEAPQWPCRSYTLIAAAVLDVCSSHIDELLEAISTR